MIYVLIPLYNRSHQTKKLINQLIAQYDNNFVVIFRDDLSTDDTWKVLTSLNYSFIHYMQSDGDEFWTKSINNCIKYVENSFNLKDDDLLLFLDNDNTLGDGFFKKIVKSNNKQVITTVSIDITDHTILPTAMKIKSYFFGLSEKYGNGIMGKRDFIFNHPKKIICGFDMLVGRGMYFPYSLVKKIGYLDQKCFPQYGSDTEFSCRAKRSGYKLCIDLSNPIYVDPADTGLNPFYKKLSLKDSFMSLFSIRSASHLPMRIRSIFKTYPAYSWVSAIPLTILKILFLTFFFNWFSRRNKIN